VFSYLVVSDHIADAEKLIKQIEERHLPRTIVITLQQEKTESTLSTSSLQHRICIHILSLDRGFIKLLADVLAIVKSAIEQNPVLDILCTPGILTPLLLLSLVILLQRGYKPLAKITIMEKSKKLEFYVWQLEHVLKLSSRYTSELAIKLCKFISKWSIPLETELEDLVKQVEDLGLGKRAGDMLILTDLIYLLYVLSS